MSWNTNMFSSPSLTGCESWSEDLKAYMDNELLPARRRAIEMHLTSCVACQQELRIMQEIQSELRADEDAQIATLDPSLKARILDSAVGTTSEDRAEVPAAIPTLPTPPAPTIRRPNWLAYGAYGSVAVMLALVFMPVFSRSRENARRSTTQSELKSIELGSSGREPDISKDESGFGSSSGVEPNKKMAPSPNYAKHLDGSNYAYVDGHVKWVQTTKAGKSFPQTGGGNFTFGDDDDDPTAPDTSVSVSRKVHREAAITVAVKDVEAASDSVDSRVKEAGGYVVNTSLSTGEGGLKNSVMELKVPVSRFDAVLRQVGGLGNVTAKDVSGQDITDKYVAANARRNVVGNELSIREAQLRVLEKRARRSEAARKWELTAEVRRLRIAAAESKARLAWLQKTANLSDMTVTLEQRKPEVVPIGFWQEVGGTGREAWNSFIQAARIPLTALIWIIAYSPFWIPALLVWRKYGGFGEKRSVQ